LPTEIVKAKMLPGKNSDTINIYVDLPTQSSIEKTKEVTTCISKELVKEDIVKNISIFLGEGLPLDFAGMVKGSALKNSSNVAEMMINIEKATTREEASYNFVHRIRPLIQQQCSYNDANIKFVELPAGPPVLADVVAEIYGGNSFESKKLFAKRIAKILSNQKTLVDVDVLADDETKSYSLKLNENKIIESGVGVEQIKKILYMAFEGVPLGVLNDENAENQIPIFVKLDDNSRLLDDSSKESIIKKLKKLKVMNVNGLMLNMIDFIIIKEDSTDLTITSKDLKPMINVIATTDQESQIYPLLDARNDILNNMSNNYEVKKTDLLNLQLIDKKTGEIFDVKFDGELRVTIDTFIDLGGAFIMALVLIFLLMVVYYENFSLAGGIVLASFLSLIGVIFAHWAMDMITADKFYLTATSLIGFIGLIGINSRNSLLIIDFSKQLMDEKGFDVQRAIAIATATRAKPILLTVLAIVFASTLLSTDAVFGGLGVALIGGTIFAYFVSLFFVPVIILGGLSKYQTQK
jgi:multidrug efflux pump subunit AcrB